MITPNVKNLSIKLDDVQLCRSRRVYSFENPLKEIEFAHRINEHFGIKLKYFQHQKINHPKIVGDFPLFFDDCDLRENIYILFCNKTSQYSVNTPKYVEFYSENTLFGNIETLEKRDFYAIGQDDFSIFNSEFSNPDYFFLIESKKSKEHLNNITEKITNFNFGFSKEFDFQDDLSFEKNVKSWEDCLNDIFMSVELHIGRKKQEKYKIHEQIMINQRRKDWDRHHQNFNSPNIS